MLRKLTFHILSVLLVFASLLLVASSDTWAQDAPNPNDAAIKELESKPLSAINAYPGYPVTGDVRAGVWNNGQAAFWDFDIFDYFRWFGSPERARGYKPEQPIKFSHVVHVQKNKMDCMYCHWNVAKSPYATIPEVETCMGCHNAIKGAGKPEWSAEIEKLTNYYNKGEVIPWNKVHVMPTYVRFNHKRHVKAGVACQECHGQVGEMPQVERVTSMKMGWCIDCHRARGASIDCYTCHY